MTFRRTPPGMVRLKHREYVRLLQSSVRGYELEREIAEVRNATARLEAELELARLEADRPSFPAGVAPSVLASVPLTVDGDVHFPALRAWVDSEVWRDREAVLQGVIASTEGDQG